MIVATLLAGAGVGANVLGSMRQVIARAKPNGRDLHSAFDIRAASASAARQSPPGSFGFAAPGDIFEENLVFSVRRRICRPSHYRRETGSCPA